MKQMRKLQEELFLCLHGGVHFVIMQIDEMKRRVYD